MDWKQCFWGVGFLVAGYLFYRGIRRKSYMSENNLPNPEYVTNWGGLIIAVIVGIILIIRSLPD